MGPFTTPPPIADSTLVLIIFIVVAAAAWIGWVLGYDSGTKAGRAQADAQLRRTLSLPPRPQR